MGNLNCPSSTVCRQAFRLLPAGGIACFFMSKTPRASAALAAQVSFSAVHKWDFEHMCFHRWGLMVLVNEDRKMFACNPDTMY